MDKKKIIIFTILIIFVIVILVFLKFQNKDNNAINNTDNSNNKADIQSMYNNESGLYEIIDKNTGEVITKTKSEESAEIELEFYKANPDYRADLPGDETLTSDNSF